MKSWIALVAETTTIGAGVGGRGAVVGPVGAAAAATAVRITGAPIFSNISNNYMLLVK